MRRAKPLKPSLRPDLRGHHILISVVAIACPGTVVLARTSRLPFQPHLHGALPFPDTAVAFAIYSGPWQGMACFDRLRTSPGRPKRCDHPHSTAGSRRYAERAKYGYSHGLFQNSLRLIKCDSLLGYQRIPTAAMLTGSTHWISWDAPARFARIPVFLVPAHRTH